MKFPEALGEACELTKRKNNVNIYGKKIMKTGRSFWNGFIAKTFIFWLVGYYFGMIILYVLEEIQGVNLWITEVSQYVLVLCTAAYAAWTCQKVESRQSTITYSKSQSAFFDKIEEIDNQTRSKTDPDNKKKQ